MRLPVKIMHNVVSGTGSRGQEVAEPQLFARGWATEFKQLVGTKLEQTRQLVATATHTAKVPYFAGLTLAMWVEALDERYFIRAADPFNADFRYYILTLEKEAKA